MNPEFKPNLCFETRFSGAVFQKPRPKRAIGQKACPVPQARSAATQETPTRRSRLGNPQHGADSKPAAGVQTPAAGTNGSTAQRMRGPTAHVTHRGRKQPIDTQHLTPKQSLGRRHVAQKRGIVKRRRAEKVTRAKRMPHTAQHVLKEAHEKRTIGHYLRFCIAVVRAHECIAKITRMPAERFVGHVEAEIAQIQLRENRNRTRVALPERMDLPERRNETRKMLELGRIERNAVIISLFFIEQMRKKSIEKQGVAVNNAAPFNTISGFTKFSVLNCPGWYTSCGRSWKSVL